MSSGALRPTWRRNVPAATRPGDSAVADPDHKDRPPVPTEGRDAVPLASPGPEHRLRADMTTIGAPTPTSCEHVEPSCSTRGRSAAPSVHATSTPSVSGRNPIGRSFVEFPNHAIRSPGGTEGPATAQVARSVPIRSASAGAPPHRVSAPLSDQVAPSPAAAAAREARRPAWSAPSRPVTGEGPTSGRSARAWHRSASDLGRCRHRSENDPGSENAA